MDRRAMLAALAGSAAGSVLTGAAAAYPERQVTIIVPWPAGGLVDIPARLLGDKLRMAFAQPVIVDHKAGAGGSIGAAVVAKSPPDGQNLMVTTSALAIGEAMQEKVPYSLLRDFQPVAALAYAPLILVTNPEKGAKTLQELVARARANPGMTFASAGNGSPGHLAGELLKSREKLSLVHVAYKGAPPAMVDQMAGIVDFHFANAAVALPQIRAGKIRALAVASSRRLALLPDVPTMAEGGVKDFDTDQWIGLLAPRGTPDEVVDRLNRLAGDALASPEVRGAIERNGMTPATPAPARQFAAEVARDLAKWTAIVRSANIKAE